MKIYSMSKKILFISGIDFKEKSKISQYVNLYGACETEYKELPNKFLMKYQK